MRIISRRTLREFWEKHPDSKQPLLRCYNAMRKATWNSLTEVRTIFSHADKVGTCIVFNIAGNKYRLITYINFQSGIVYILHVLTHAEYDSNEWKSDCDC